MPATAGSLFANFNLHGKNYYGNLSLTEAWYLRSYGSKFYIPGFNFTVKVAESEAITPSSRTIVSYRFMTVQLQSTLPLSWFSPVGAFAFAIQSNRTRFTKHVRVEPAAGCVSLDPKSTWLLNFAGHNCKLKKKDEHPVMKMLRWWNFLWLAWCKPTPEKFCG